MPLRFGPFTFDDASRELRRDGALVTLSPKASLLLQVLIEARPRAVARETLIERVWPDVVVEPGNLHGLVAEIRSGAGDRNLIRTVHRIGYAFDAPALAEESTRFSIMLGDEEIPLRSGENVIGRDPRDAVVIHAHEVSRHHARLTVAGSLVTLEDLGSKNGTFVGRQRVTSPVEVKPGDEILIGTTKLRLVRVNAMATTATI